MRTRGFSIIIIIEASLAEYHRIPYHVFPITKENKISQEQAELDLLKKNNIDVVVLAKAVDYHAEHRILVDG